MNSPHIEIPEKPNKDNIVRLISLFEVKRPKKSNSTLRKSKSISSLSTAISSDDEENKHCQKKAITTYGSSPNGKNKRRSKSVRSYEDNSKVKHIIDDIERTNKMVDDFGEKLRMKRQQRYSYQIERSDHHQKSKHSSHKVDMKCRNNYDEIDFATNNSDGDTDQYTKCVQSLDRRFSKNGIKKKHSSTYDTCDAPCKELISRKRNKVQSFANAQSESEIESYRKDLVDEIDLTLNKLKIDGFIDEDENDIHGMSQEEEYVSFEGIVKEFEDEERPTWAQRVNIRRESMQFLQDNEDYVSHQERPNDVEKESRFLDDENTENDVFDNDCDEVCRENYISPIYENITDDEFGESLAEDLEQNGSYFVEAYNDEGKELIIVEIAVERRAVDLASLDAITESIKNSDIVFQQNDDKSLNIIENPKELVNVESISSGFVTNTDSNRSTVYSTTSRDSELYDTDDEGISLGSGQKHEDDDTYNCRRETFCDNKGIVRIERVGYPEIGNVDDAVEPSKPVSRNNSFAQKGT